MFFVIACGNNSSYNSGSQQADTVKDFKPALVEDSILTQLFHPDEINIRMIFKKIKNAHIEKNDVETFYIQFDLYEKSEKKYQKDIGLLDSLALLKDTSLFIRTTENLIGKKQVVSEFYYKMIFFSCQTISENTYLSDHTKAQLIHKYFNLIKNDFNLIYPEFYKDFLEYGKYEITDLKNKKGLEFNQQRKQLLLFWIQSGMFYQAAIDTNFNFHKIPLSNIPIPQGFVGSDEYFAGISSSSIKEPELRKAYHDSLFVNSWNSRKYTMQVGLRKGYKELTRYLDNDLFLLYSLPPQNNAELDSILNEYVVDTAFKQSAIRYINESFLKNK